MSLVSEKNNDTRCLALIHRIRSVATVVCHHFFWMVPVSMAYCGDCQYTSQNEQRLSVLIDEQSSPKYHVASVPQSLTFKNLIQLSKTRNTKWLKWNDIFCTNIFIMQTFYSTMVITWWWNKHSMTKFSLADFGKTHFDLLFSSHSRSIWGHEAGGEMTVKGKN